jgi:hypothetical protein
MAGYLSLSQLRLVGLLAPGWPHKAGTISIDASDSLEGWVEITNCNGLICCSTRGTHE